MGLFGRKDNLSSMSEADIEAERQKQIEESMREELKNRYKAVSEINGSKGRGDEPFEKGVDYIFHITEDKYVFEPVFFESFYAKKEDLKRALNTTAIEFDKDSVKVVLENNTLIETAYRSAVGETSVEIEPIKVTFVNKDNEFQAKFMFINKPQNISPNADFFKEIGVKNFYNITDVPEYVMQVKVLNGNGFVSNKATFVIFRNEDKLTLLRLPAKGKSTSSICEIEIDEILYYRQEGALRYEQQVTGSGGGSTSYAGAIVGGLLFGVTGAVIGSKANEKEINISTETVEKDTRILYLAVKRDGIIYQISFSLDAEMVFDWILPDKQYDYVIQKRREMYAGHKK